MKRAAFSAAAFCLLTAVQSFGLGGDHDPSRPIAGGEGWPPALTKAMNGAQCVGGYFVNANDRYFFAGDAKAANGFFEECAKVRKTPLKVIVHPGSGFCKKPWEETRTPCDWTVSVQRRGWTSPETFDGVDDDVDLLITIDLWLGGDFSLSDLHIPASVDVESDGEIEKFVTAHKIKRKHAMDGNKQAPAESNKREGEEAAAGK
jgi:hypothetical protein